MRYEIQLRRTKDRVEDATDGDDNDGDGYTYQSCVSWYNVVDTKAVVGGPDRIVCEATRKHAIRIAAALEALDA
jgi:hypothetical protein